jgi:hypothetical protein
MEVNCLNCEDKLAKYLCDVPEKWRTQIVKAMCLAIEADNATLDCSDVNKCAYTANLSAFYRNGSSISIDYTDEYKNTVTRSFNYEVLVENSMDGLDPKCIATQEDWDAMTYLEKIQTIIDYDCACCPND